MSESKRWQRLGTEGVLIVVSILLAFGIQAIWEGIAQKRAVVDQLEQVRAQMLGDIERLNLVRGWNASALEAQYELIRLIGPSPRLVSRDSLSTLFDAAFSVGTFDLGAGALDALLRSGEFDAAGREDLHRTMSRFYAFGPQHRRDGDLFSDQRARVVEYMVSIAPIAFLTEGSGGHEPTDFGVPMTAILSDPQLEGLVAQLTVTMRRMIGIGDMLLRDAQAISDSIGPRRE